LKTINKPFEEKEFAITRFLGHKFEMPGSAQWRILTAQSQDKASCFVCDKHVYTLIFWSKGIKREAAVKLPSHAVEGLARQLKGTDVEGLAEMGVVGERLLN
jgi:hypothetical protein